MPWRGPEEQGEFPTLGYQVADLIESKCAIPDGDHRGDPFMLTDEMLRFLLWFYRLDPETCSFVYDRGGQLCRPQKWGKGPFSAAIICAEGDPEGPVRPDGWDANGEPVGRPWVTPEIQVTGITEDNAGNVWRALVPMIELGKMNADIPDTGVTRINLPGGGLIRPVTSAHLSRIGQRLRFVVQDQTESWTISNHGRDLADAQRRNLAGMNGRWLSTPNAWDPADASVAQQTATEPGVYIDDVDPGPGSIRNKVERRKMLRRVYGDSVRVSATKGWVVLDRIESEIEALLPRDPAQAERWFLNRKRATEGGAFDPKRWGELAQPPEALPADTLVTIGVHGPRFTDALVVVGTVVQTGRQWVIGSWETPPTPSQAYEHPANAIDGAVSEVWDSATVWRLYMDPGMPNLLARWQGRWGEKRVIEWPTNRPRQSADALRNFTAGIVAGDLTHEGDDVLGRHIENAKRRKVNVYDDERRQMWVIGKERDASPLFINGAWAACLSWEARRDAIASGALEAEEVAELVSW